MTSSPCKRIHSSRQANPVQTPLETPPIKELTSLPCKRTRNFHQEKLLQTPLQTPPAKKQRIASPTQTSTRPSTYHIRTRSFKAKALKGHNPIPASSSFSPLQTPVEAPPAKNQPRASPTPTSTRPSMETVKTRRFKPIARKGRNPVPASSSSSSLFEDASVPDDYPQPMNMQTVAQAVPGSLIQPEPEPIKPGSSPEATAKAEVDDDVDSFFASLMMKPTPNSHALGIVTVNSPYSAEEIELAKMTFRSLLSLSFSDILCPSHLETFAKTLNTLVNSQAFNQDLQPALWLFKHGFSSLSQTYESTQQRKAEVDNQLQQAKEFSTKLNLGLESFQKLKKAEEDAQAEKKVVEDQIRQLQSRLFQLDGKLTDLSSEKNVLYHSTKVNSILYEKVAGDLPSLYFTKSKLEVELNEIEKAWVNFRSRFDSQ